MKNREIKYVNRFNAKAKRSRNDWKAKRKDRRQYIFNGNVKSLDYDEFARCVCVVYVPVEEITNGFDKRKSAFMTEDEEEYERWERERYCYEA